LGFALGPMVWAPMSEVYGRKMPLVISAFGMGLFQIAVATAENIQTIIICRFFAGCFASCSLAVVGAAFADIFPLKTRGKAMSLFAGVVFAAPMLAPIAGGFMVLNPNVGWRWTEYITAIGSFIAMVTVLFGYSESFAPVVLMGKAAQLRRATGNWGIHAKQEEVELSLRDLVVKNVGRPLRMLFEEPVILLITIYTAFIYGILYLFLTAIPIVFQEYRGFNSGTGALPFLAVIVGEVGGAVFVVACEPWYMRRVKDAGGRPVAKARLLPMMAGAVIFPIGLFWFAWTGTADVHYMVPTISLICLGFAILCIFLQAINYIIDSFLALAASALAANTLGRSLCGAIFPLFAQQMFNNLGVPWAGSLLGFLAVACIPIPIIFYTFNDRIARSSKRIQYF